MKPMLDFTKPMTKCERCQALIVLAVERRNEDSHPFRLAKVPKGVCASCVMTQFLYNTYPINMQIDEAGPELLLKSGLREAFLSSGLLVHSDLNIDEVDWEQVVANRKLPVKIQKSGLNPYRMGEAPRARARAAGAPWPTPFPPEPEYRTDVFAGLGKEQYCPKCGNSCGPTPVNPHAYVIAGTMTDCRVCGYQGNDVHLRELPSGAVQ